MTKLRNLDVENDGQDVPSIGVLLIPPENYSLEAERDHWTAKCQETGLTGTGPTPDEAVESLEVRKAGLS